MIGLRIVLLAGIVALARLTAFDAPRSDVAFAWICLVVFCAGFLELVSE